MKLLDSVLGLIFEGSFKLGFLKNNIVNYTDFAESVFEKLKAKAEKDSELLQIIKDIENSFSKYNPFNPLNNMKHLSRLLFANSLEEDNDNEIKKEWKEIYTKLVFAIGFASGYFYNKNFKNLELKKYDFGDESQNVIWQNADLVFLDNKTLYIIDFKLGGTRKVLKDILTKKEKRIPIRTYGVPVAISIGELEFYNFLKKFMQVKNKFIETEYVFMENKGLLQILSYAVDFLCTEKDEIEEISLGLLYPMQESLNLRFFIKEREKLQDFLEEIKYIYINIKNKESSYKEADTESHIRRKRIIKETMEAIANIEKELQKREKEKLLLQTGDINLVRNDVVEKLQNFIKNPKPIKAIALLHSAGSGKTSRTRELILNLPGKHIVLYTATRISLLDREYKELKKIKKTFSKSIELVYEQGKYENNSIQDKGNHQEIHNPNNTGKIKNTVEKIRSLITKNKKPDIIWAFTTIQAFVETISGKKTSNTSEHLTLFLRPSFKDYHIHIILDEFLGYKNGFFAIESCFKFLKKLETIKRKANLYIFDANGYSPNLIVKLLEEYKKFKIIPEALILTDYNEEIRTEYEGISFEIYAKHGFPANGLIIYKKFIKVKGKKEEIAKYLALYIYNTLNVDRSTGFAFIQDKEIIYKLAENLKALGLTFIIATASSKQTQDKINKGREDIILGTSSVSRGLNFSRPHKPVDQIYILIQSWGIENNLVEILQAISRARGDKETENRQKELHLIYVINQDIDEAVDNIVSYLDYPDKNLVRLIYTKEQLESFLDLDDVVTKIVKNFLSKPSIKVLVPIPTQHKSKMVDNIVSTYENVVSFVEDIYDSEINNDEYRNKIAEFAKNLKELAEISTYIPNNLEVFSFYSPYILCEKHPIFFKVDEEKRNKLKVAFEEFEDIFKKHNKDRAKEVKEFLESRLSAGQVTVPLLIPIYSIIFVNNLLCKNEKLDFIVSNRAGRGYAKVLGGDLNLKTCCYLGNSTEYACIPLGENYPYKEVLYGRFAKFPVKFIKNLLKEE